MPTIYLVRHCSASGQESDAPLTENGTQQTQVLRDFFQDQSISRILSSDYVRAIASIQPVADSLQLSIEQEPLLRERILALEPREDWLDLLRLSFEDSSFKLPDAESGQEAVSRILQVTKRFSDLNEIVILVTHGNLLALLLQHLDPRYDFETWRTMSNPDVYRLDFDDRTPVIEHVWPNK